MVVQWERSKNETMGVRFVDDEMVALLVGDYIIRHICAPHSKLLESKIWRATDLSLE